ncbi:MAG: hypothetical protein NPIRA02_29710 [Nitrospirales bacterium]|nr:MAG: hypothetical protein NPIRA02_29710 [Nitrospirales bacterium]
MSVRWGSQAKLARELNVSPQRLCLVLREYKGKRNKKRELNLDEAAKWYEERSQQSRRKRKADEQLDPRMLNKTPSYLESQAKKEAAIARIKEMEADEKAEKLFDLQAGIKIVSQLATAVKEALVSMDERLPSKLATLNDKRKIKQLLKEEHAKSLKSLEDITFK